jgi:hypothetical protein
MMAEKKSRLCAEIKKFSIQSAHLSNYHISLWGKVFFFILNQFFFNTYESCPLLRGVTKNNKNPVAYWEHGMWQFYKKIWNKTFFFHMKKKYHFIYFFLVLALESISGVKSWFFGKNIRRPKKEDPPSQIKKIYHPVSINKKVAHSTQESPKKSEQFSLLGIRF